MSTNDELWDQLSLRVARSQLGGVTAEDDDVLAAADLLEALINPNRGGQSGAGGGAGMPGMMPPMMMGGMGGAGMGAGAGGGAARPAEASMGPMAVPNPATTAAGVPGEARMKEQPPPSGGGGGGPIGSGGSRIGTEGGLGGGGGVNEVSGLGGGARELPGEDEPAIEGQAPEPDSEVGGVAMVSTPPANDKPIDGFAVDPVQVRALGDRWAELGASVSALPHHPEADMGLFERAQRPHQALSQQINSWREGAAEEFEAIAARLHATAAQYEGADDEGVRAIRQTEGLNP